MRKLIWALAVTSALIFPFPVIAGQCAPADKLEAFLTDKHKETVHAQGIAGKRSLMQVYVGESGTWTVVVTRPNGLSCMVTSGSDYQDIPAISEDPDA